jgi:hypothetical protein
MPQKTAPALVPSDTSSIISIDNIGPIQVETRIANEMAKPQAPSTIREIILTKNIASAQTRVSGPEMISLMEIDPPDNLKRSLTSPWMLGIYNDEQNQKSIFVVATTNFFQNAFAGMLQWESVMADDLKQYLYPASGPYGIANAPAYVPPLNFPPFASTTASTTTPTASTTSTVMASTTATSTNFTVQPYFTLRGRFEDRIIKNKDVREFRTFEGNTLFLYSFVDTSKIVVAGNEQVLAEILTRLEKQAFIR